MTILTDRVDIWLRQQLEPSDQLRAGNAKRWGLLPVPPKARDEKNRMIALEIERVGLAEWQRMCEAEDRRTMDQ